MSGKTFLLWLLVIGTFSTVQAKEGMWIPTLLNKYNIEEMQQMGFRLTPDDIYNVNQVSMKDAVVLFGSGCTGELVSNEGLLLTNHHCGFDAIQNHSSVEHDYLTHGFWAKSKSDELPNPGLSVRFLNRMEDVTDQVLTNTANKSSDSIAVIQKRNTRKIIAAASENGKYEAAVQPLFYGNQYFLYVYEVFTDVRLVGAPPTSIGKFGGDTDNWMWPRHTGDFSVFRIYANKDNQPAKYSPENVPYKPKKYFKISLNGVQPEDFTMVIGYPARTQQFLPSMAIRQIMEQSDPDKIAIRSLKLGILAADMEKDAKVRIQYASKYASTSNAWKKWQGEVKGLKRLNAIQKKQEAETAFLSWAGQNPERNRTYGKVFQELDKQYTEQAPYSKAKDYYDEVIVRGTDLFSITSYFFPILNSKRKLTESDFRKIEQALANEIKEHFNEFNQETDEKVFVVLMKKYSEDLEGKYLPQEFTELFKKRSSDEVLQKIYRESIFSDQEKLVSVIGNLNEHKLKMLRNDPAFAMYASLKTHYESNIEPYYSRYQKQIDETLNIYLAGYLEMNANKPVWADANKTFRVAYGKVEGYEPVDGVVYNYFTTIEGIMEKDQPEIYDYNIPEELRVLYRLKDYGRYGQNGTLNVCFSASNHTTGGNSGSPVLNAEGQLIGLNFDRCWEGTMSDLMFDPDRCRNIVLDIRYTLFIIDKIGKANYLIDEMEIVE